ncbi:MAG: DUF1854 domain-containing protein [Planctomycetes bacterium]|nr:DUF1854 domain-containing protein [Planctomycetota bacterium]
MPETSIVMSRKLDRAHAAIDGADAVPVRVVWARPITGRGAEVAFLGDAKVALAMIPTLDVLDPRSRTIAQEELDRRYCVARITRVHSASVNFGNRYWDVETDRGRRRFLFREVGKHVTRITADHLLIRDTLANRFEIASLAALDQHSRDQVNQVI